MHRNRNAPAKFPVLLFTCLLKVNHHTTPTDSVGPTERFGGGFRQLGMETEFEAQEVDLNLTVLHIESIFNHSSDGGGGCFYCITNLLSVKIYTMQND